MRDLAQSATIRPLLPHKSLCLPLCVSLVVSHLTITEDSDPSYHRHAMSLKF
jgi:hypothetical protein